MKEKQSNEVEKDIEHLRLLTIFHYILAGITAVFSFIPLIHVSIGTMILSSNRLKSTENPPPDIIGWLFVIIGSICIILGLTYALTLFLSGRFIARKRHRIFSIVIACISCLSIPFGTILGIFTLIILSKPAVKILYEKRLKPVH